MPSQSSSSSSQRPDGDDTKSLITLYEQTAKSLKDKIDATKELVESLEEDMEEWEQDLATLNTQLTKICTENRMNQ